MQARQGLKLGCLVILACAACAACARMPAATTELGLMPRDDIIRQHDAVGCFIMDWERSNLPSTSDSALYISPPKFLRLTGRRAEFGGRVWGFGVEPEVYMWYGPDVPVNAYWEPYPGADSVQLTWRIVDAGTFMVLRPVSDSLWTGYLQSWYHQQLGMLKIGVTARRTRCLKMRPHTSA